MSTFLPADEVRILTGKSWKSKQIEALKKMRIAFFVNALGYPIVTKTAVEGKKEEAPTTKQWSPPDGPQTNKKSKFATRHAPPRTR
ncbi:DUF4224 domain-containing protein [Undibacterium sp. TC9W]|uniref:DUF4224 domain-containing protein n=1 Tax=Undibacterium sp. TC9W TaxID=3413053 RepID=UPI003BF27C66